ncbi:MAG: CDGSH iron-sulfur domain-containing protein [Beijerinckiaceae bacterium]
MCEILPLSKLTRRRLSDGTSRVTQDARDLSLRGKPLEPTIAQKTPIAVDVEAGKTVYWCSCGLSTNQPFCNGAHKQTSFTPQAYTPEQAGKAYFCACKHTKNAPLCDGSHKAL